MERIILEVDEQTARAWRDTPAAVRSEIEKNIEAQLNRVLSRANANSFEQLLSEEREEATANGLTEEILQKLLEENDSKLLRISRRS